jgi:SAM-dependent methyltransferase
MSRTADNADDKGAADLVRQAFNELYSKEERVWWRQDGRYETHSVAYPDSLLTQLMLLRIECQGRVPEGARALDLGAGEGADAIRLARLHYDVTAVEISEVAERKIRRFAAEAGVRVRTVVADISTYKLQDEFDIIICNGVLHYIEDKKVVIERMQQATRPGGMNVVAAWSTTSPVPEAHGTLPVFCDDEDGEINRLYSNHNWQKFLYFERHKPETAHVAEPGHVHSHIKMLAWKTGAA